MPASDDSKSAIKGGVYKGISPLNLLQIDPHQPGGHIGVVRRVYSQLFRVKDGYLSKPTATSRVTCSSRGKCRLTS